MSFQSDAWEGTKDAWTWCFPNHPYTVGWHDGAFLGGGDLFFSSPEKFKELLGRPMDEYDTLVRVRVPADFDNWDYFPSDY